MAVEIHRKDQGDGTTLVTVGVGATGQALVTVQTYALDQPGYHDMLDALVAKQMMLRDIRDGRVGQ